MVTDREKDRLRRDYGQRERLPTPWLWTERKVVYAVVMDREKVVYAVDMD